MSRADKQESKGNSLSENEDAVLAIIFRLRGIPRRVICKPQKKKEVPATRTYVEESTAKKTFYKPPRKDEVTPARKRPKPKKRYRRV